MKKISYSLRIGIIGNRELIKEIFLENLQKIAIESNSSDDNFEFLIVFKQIPIKTTIFLAETLENIINNYEEIQRLDIIILTLDLYDKKSLQAMNLELMEEFNESFLFQGLPILVGMDIKQIFKGSPSKRFKISRYQLKKTTEDLNLIYCFEIFNKDRDVNEIYSTLFNDFILRFQYSSPELFETAKEYGKKLLS
ncbi:MAG: hypothetical protein ACFE8J_17430 [Candidatus Heimdallarchaeota archaeon]